tara:strand:- start:7084 stop:7470 length:387 start_codon:yes stop_codon:yes gene_type:complete
MDRTGKRIFSQQVLDNFGVGGKMAAERALRTRIPQGNALPNLGKSLTHHQVIPAVQALRTANKPRVDAFKRGITAGAMSGHPLVGAVAGAITSKLTGQVSHHDAKQILSGSVLKHREYTPQAKSLVSH